MFAKHFREDDIEHVFKVPNPDGSFSEIPRTQPKLRAGAVPSSYLAVLHIIQNHQLLYIGYLLRKRSLIISAKLYSQKEEEEIYRVNTLEELKEKLSSQNIPSNWVSRQSNGGEFHLISPCKIHHQISVQSSLTIF